MIAFYFIKKIKKDFSKGLKKNGGRNFLGRICIRGQGGGNKSIYRFIDFFRRLNYKGKVLSIIYDKNRSTRLALILYINSLCAYILIQKNVRLYSLIYSGSLPLEEKDEIKEGYSLPLKYMPLFSSLCNIEKKPFLGSTICRVAENSCIMVGKENNKAILKLSSGWEFHLSLDCISSFGINTYKNFNNYYLEKAGKKRALGFRPKVRGVVKNPCDHPHGGGRGKKGKPIIPVNSWHSIFKWKHTNNKKMDKKKRRFFKKM